MFRDCSLYTRYRIGGRVNRFGRDGSANEYKAPAKRFARRLLSLYAAEDRDWSWRAEMTTTTTSVRVYRLRRNGRRHVNGNPRPYYDALW